MFRKMAKKNISRNKLVTFLLILFVMAASFLISLASIMIENLSKSVDSLIRETKIPHYMQMHAGDIEKERLYRFAKEDSNVESLQIVTFLNIDNSRLSIGTHSMVDQVGDNGFCVQNQEFDYLIDSEQNVIQVNEGEAYIPICYWKELSVKKGDILKIGEKELTIAGFLRDGQMNSSFASSKRFLINEKDYEEIEPYGEKEYLIEFRLINEKELATFAERYMAANLECNGPAITYPFFRLTQVLSDGIMIAIIILISIIIVLIAFLCIRFTLLTKLEEDVREIGIMKAIGMSIKDIRMFYLGTYIVIALVGSIVGYIVSLLSKDLFLYNIRLYMGDSSNEIVGCMLGMAGSGLIFLWVVSYVKRILKRISKISAASALRNDETKEKSIYLTMLLLLTLIVSILVIPQNLYETMSSDSLITYMGVGKCQMRIDLQRQSDYSKSTGEIEDILNCDQDMKQYAVYYTKNVPILLEDGTVRNLKLEEGDQSIFPISYVEGMFPKNQNEIALSYLNAKELGKEVGSEIVIKGENTIQTMKVSGIYSDITNGGLTAKAVPHAIWEKNDILWSVICVDFQSGIDTVNKVTEYQGKCAEAKIASVDQYIGQTLGNSISTLKKTTIFSTFLGLFLAALVVSLFMRMIIVRDRYSIVVRKGLGFTTREIQMQYVARSAFVLGISLVIGTIISNVLGEKIFGVFLETMGASKLIFVINPWISYVCYPILLLVTVLSATVFTTHAIKYMTIVDSIYE